MDIFQNFAALGIFDTRTFGIIALVTVGASWSLVGLVMGDAPKKGVDVAMVQFFGAIVATIAGFMIVLTTGAGAADVESKWILITVGLYFSSGFLNFFMLQLMSKAMQTGPNGIIWAIIQSAMIFPFTVGMIFFNTDKSMMKIIGIVLLVTALIGFGLAKNNTGKGGSAWRWLSFCALAICATQQNLATLPTYYPECRKVGSAFCTMATAGGTMIASLIFTALTLTADKRRRLKENLTNRNLWKYVALLQGFSLFTSYFLLYPGMFILGKNGLSMLGYPVMVGSCIVSFTLISMLLLKEKVKPLQIAALLLCISGLICLIFR